MQFSCDQMNGVQLWERSCCNVDDRREGIVPAQAMLAPERQAPDVVLALQTKADLLKDEIQLLRLCHGPKCLLLHAMSCFSKQVQITLLVQVSANGLP